MEKSFFKQKRFWIVISIVLAILVIRFTGIAEYITLENIRYHKVIIADFIKRRYWTSMFIFWCLYVAENIFALPTAAFLTLGAGFFYGVVPATILTVISATSGAIVLFYMARYFFGDSLQKKYAVRLTHFNKAFEEQGVYFLLSVRCIPLVPFAVVNVFAGLTLVPITTFIWTTVVGMIPGTLIYVLAGQQLQKIQSVGDVFSVRVLLIFMALALLALLPVIVQHYKSNK
jgi:uncharacterized membrane protein YdjX (TVP38/TMEM64 family)